MNPFQIQRRTCFQLTTRTNNSKGCSIRATERVCQRIIVRISCGYCRADVCVGSGIFCYRPRGTVTLRELRCTVLVDIRDADSDADSDYETPISGNNFLPCMRFWFHNQELPLFSAARLWGQ